jgi:protein-tyrosine-phosphatase
MTDGKINVLFVCKDNSIRSIIAHALLNRFSGDRFRVFSCGLEPAAEIHRRTIEMLSAQGLPLEHRRPRSLSEFLGNCALEMDFVINLCDEPLPRLPGSPFIAHWGITDPLSEGGDAARETMAFGRTFRELENRVRLFALLPHQSRAQRLTRKESGAEAA